MLSLQLKSGEYLTIGEDIAVQVFQSGSSFRVAVKAPREVPIVRGELRERGGDARPAELRTQRPKSPADKARDARRARELEERRARSAAREDAVAQAMREAQDILARMDGLTAQSGGGHDLTELREEIEGLQKRLELMERATG